ncbi:MAG: acetate--CoA ligase family protein [bacterium]
MSTNHKDLSCIFRPTSVAVLGASSRPGAIGREVVKNLINFEFQGKVFLVNPKRDVVLSMKAYPSVLEIPDPVDLAVIVVPGPQVLEVVHECGKAGVKGLVIITAGFREVGGAGAEREEELAKVIEGYDMLAIGPNSVGIMNADPRVRLNASFITTIPKSGNVALLSQSGSIGETIMDFAQYQDLRFSIFASLGNQMSVDSCHLLDYLRRDEQTEVVLMYVESFRRSQEFVSVAKRITREKPVLVVKAGRTAAGAHAAFSHTGALAGMDVSYDALFEECGIVRVSTVEELFDLGRAVSHMSPPEGDRVAVLTNAGGPAILATDALVAHGLQMAQFSGATTETLREKLNPAAAVSNPVDMVAGAGPADYEISLRAVLQDPGVDAVLTILVPPVMIDGEEVARTIVRIYDEYERPKPMLVCLMGLSKMALKGRNILADAGLPTYLFPEAAALAMRALWRVGQHIHRPPEPPLERLAADAEAARAIVTLVRRAGRTVLTLEESLELMQAYGVNVLPWEPVTGVEDALAAAERLGFPMVAKLDEPGLTHKTESGGVIPDLRDEGALVRAIQSLREIAATHRNGGADADAPVHVVLQSMAKGHETIIGMTTDPTLGPLLLFGYGGIYVEVIKDIAFRLHPVSIDEARNMIARIGAYPLLTGARGDDPVDLDELTQNIARLSQLAGDLPEIAEMEINPFFAAAPGRRSGAADARIRLK